MSENQLKSYKQLLGALAFQLFVCLVLDGWGWQQQTDTTYIFNLLGGRLIENYTMYTC